MRRVHPPGNPRLGSPVPTIGAEFLLDTLWGIKVAIKTMCCEPEMNRHRRAWGGVSRTRGGQCVSLLVVLTFLLVTPSLSWGHAAAALPLPPSQESVPEPSIPDGVPSGASPSLPPVALLLLAALGLGWVTWRWRRVAALSLALVLGFFAFETAVHSVHHLSDPQKATQCQVLSASQHVTGAPAETSGLCAPPLAAEARPSAGAESLLPPGFLRPDQGRAPPSLLA